MAWSCPFCKLDYARRIDHDSRPSAAECKRQELERANDVFREVKTRRDALEINTGQLDKEFNSAWRKVRRLQGW